MTDPTGVGKSFVAWALAQKACRDGYSVLLYRAAVAVPRSCAGACGRQLRGLLAELAAIDVLVVDDWAMAPLTGNRAPRLLGDLRRPLSAPLARFSLRSCRWRAGMSRSAIRRWPTASSTDWFTMPTASR